MKRILYAVFTGFLMLALMISCKTNSPDAMTDSPPEWSKNVIWYQIFVERFNNGDLSNDPTIQTISTPTASFPVPEDWSVTPWTSDWYTQEPWASKTGHGLRETMQHRRYGGDLQGIFDKLDYLTDLGITAIYFNPLNDAPSLHKYDARHYHHIDVNFGPDPEGDMQIIASEDLSDPETWKWTSADKMFLRLVEELHSRGIRVIVDFSWNHTGVLFPAWKDLIENQQNSQYKDWYEVITWDDLKTPENEFQYKGWLNIMSLPELRKTNVVGERKHGFPFEGNIDDGAKKHIFEVTKRWLAPDGDVGKGIDGFRLDVAEQIPMGFWRDYNAYVKSINPEAYLVGEIWWEKWPDDFMNPAPYTNDSVFDAVMFYQAYRPARGFFAEGYPKFDAAGFAAEITKEWNNVAEPYRYGMMNVSATHDSPRLLSCFANKGKYKFRASPHEDTAYISGRPDEETYQRVKMYLAHQFTSIGSPHIWNGDEFGMWGGDDPDERKPLWWDNLKFDDETRTNIKPGTKQFDKVGFNHDLFNYYKKLISIRKQNPVLSDGNLTFISSDGNILSYTRENKAGHIMLAAFNTGASETTINLPFEGNFTDLLTGNTGKGKSFILAPMTAVILKPEN
ncbi:MAG: alpha-amylase [Bacteroidetes bacterium HGW-Bacteroidetes-11]|jgi:glycosidase|nr:MAG: alpha-amylase [Bacteroidetes bacterium HGW-Bacteroidetes-11]